MKNVFAMIGAGLGSYPTDKLGRKWMILMVQVIMVGGCILEQLSTHWTHWLGARFMDVCSYQRPRLSTFLLKHLGSLGRSGPVLHQRVHRRNRPHRRPRRLNEPDATYGMCLDANALLETAY